MNARANDPELQADPRSLDAVMDVLDDLEPAPAGAAAQPADVPFVPAMDEDDQDMAAAHASLESLELLDVPQSEPQPQDSPTRQQPQQPQLQLRILSGLHAGARAPLDGDSYLLGALDDCDFVLDDAGVQPHHARLSWQSGCWQVDWVAQEGEEPVLAPMRLTHGKAVPLGPLVITVDAPDAPWPTLEQLVLVPHAPALEPNLPAPPEPVPAPATDWAARLRALASRRAATRFAAAALGLSAVAALALVAWPGGLGAGSATSAPAAAVAKAPVPDAAQRQAIEAVLAGRGLAGRARIEPSGAVWLIRAPVMSDMEAEALGGALSRLQPRPLMRLPTAQELRDEVTEALPRLAGEHAPAIRLRVQAPGRFRLEGRIADTQARDAFLRTVADTFPQVTWENAVLTTEEAAAELLAELRSRGWQAGGQWKDGALQVQVTLQQRDVPNWEQTLLAVNRTHAVPLHATMAFAQSAPTPAPAPRGAEARLPFQVRGVVGGELPYVLLAGGDKLSQGGVWQGWRLASISAGQVVFENGTQRAVLAR